MARSVSSELLASWVEPISPNGVITNYTVYCALLTAENEMPPVEEYTIMTISPGSGLSVVVEDLEAFTFYRCFVRAATSVGMGPASEQVTTRTSQDSEQCVQCVMWRV